MILGNIKDMIQAATQGIFQTKVDKVEGKGLSTNDFANTYKNKLNNFKWFMITTANLIPTSLRETEEYTTYVQDSTEENFLNIFDKNDFEEVFREYINSSRFFTFAELDYIVDTLSNDGLFFVSFLVPSSWGKDETYLHYICQFNISGNRKLFFISRLNQSDGLTSILNSKVDSFQGVENSGKYLKIDSNGNVVCSSAPNEAGNIDLSNYIEKSNVSGLVKNDGSIDRNVYIKKSQSSYANKNVVVNALGEIDFENKPVTPNYGYIDDNFNLNVLYLEISLFQYNSMANENEDNLIITVSDELDNPLEGIYVDFYKQATSSSDEQLIETVVTDSNGIASTIYEDDNSQFLIARVSDTIEEKIQIRG